MWEPRRLPRAAAMVPHLACSALPAAQAALPWELMAPSGSGRC
jgi:hypothetical protein